MSVTVVIGGQFGSEGKGKVAHLLASRDGVGAVVRVGGPNSGHTVVGADGRRTVLRQLPVAALLPDRSLILPPGTYVDPEVLLTEIQRFRVAPERLAIDPAAVLIGADDRSAEARLQREIGSTGSGVGQAVLRRVSRDGSAVFAGADPRLASYVRPTTPILRGVIENNEEVVIEGTQGFGLSLLHGGFGRFATSRDTSAAGFVAETGISPLDVTGVVMVIRAFPIRVAGNSGPLPREIDWSDVARSAAVPGLVERTTVTNRVRRVAHFDPDVVRRAIETNRPTSVVLNHVDYLADLSTDAGVDRARTAVSEIESALEREIDFVGTSPACLLSREEWSVSRAEALARPASA